MVEVDRLVLVCDELYPPLFVNEDVAGTTKAETLTDEADAAIREFVVVTAMAASDKKVLDADKAHFIVEVCALSKDTLGSGTRVSFVSDYQSRLQRHSSLLASRYHDGGGNLDCILCGYTTRP